MECRMTIVSSPTRMSLTTRRTIRCRTFRPRLSRRRRDTFGVSFSPAASDKALKAIRQTVRSWTLHERSDKTLGDLARMFNANIRGWINTTDATTSRRFIRPYATSTAYWHGGRIGSSSPSDDTVGEHSSGWLASRAANHCCLLTGGCCRGMAEQWEPDEAGVLTSGSASAWR